MQVILVENIMYKGNRVLAGSMLELPDNIAENFVKHDWAHPVNQPVQEQAPVVEEPKVTKKKTTKRAKK